MTRIEPIRTKRKLEVLDARELADIRQATLDVLHDVGIHFPSEQALDVFSEHGAEVDREQQIVRLSPELVEEAMSRAPRSYTLSGRADGTDLVLDGTASYFATDGCGTETVDFESGEHRRSRKDDIAWSARLADALSSIAFYWPMVSAQDYGRLAPLHELDASFNNTVKHVQSETAMGGKLAQYAVRMAETIAGGEAQMRVQPPLSVLICTVAPLGQDKHGIEAGMVYAKAGIPVGFMSMPTIGSTAPATAAGALVVGNAEVVSAMVLMQLVAPGTPVYHSLLPSVMDPRSAAYMAGIPEKYLDNTAAVQLAHDWGVPTLAGSFGVDASEPASWKHGRDSVYTALMVAMAGAETAAGLGMLRACTLLTPDQLIFDDETYHMNRVVAEGIDVNPDTLAVEVIRSVGPRGHFLAQNHTRSHVRDIWIPELTHPAPSEPDPDIRRRARARVDRILAEHEVEPLEEDVRTELQRILSAAERELGR